MNVLVARLAGHIRERKTQGVRRRAVEVALGTGHREVTAGQRVATLRVILYGVFGRRETLYAVATFAGALIGSSGKGGAMTIRMTIAARGVREQAGFIFLFVAAIALDITMLSLKGIMSAGMIEFVLGNRFESPGRVAIAAIAAE